MKQKLSDHIKFITEMLDDEIDSYSAWLGHYDEADSVKTREELQERIDKVGLARQNLQDGQLDKADADLIEEILSTDIELTVADYADDLYEAEVLADVQKGVFQDCLCIALVRRAI